MPRAPCRSRRPNRCSQLLRPITETVGRNASRSSLPYARFRRKVQGKSTTAGDGASSAPWACGGCICCLGRANRGYEECPCPEGRSPDGPTLGRLQPACRSRDFTFMSGSLGGRVLMALSTRSLPRFFTIAARAQCLQKLPQRCGAWLMTVVELRNGAWVSGRSCGPGRKSCGYAARGLNGY